MSRDCDSVCCRSSKLIYKIPRRPRNFSHQALISRSKETKTNLPSPRRTIFSKKQHRVKAPPDLSKSPATARNRRSRPPADHPKRALPDNRVPIHTKSPHCSRSPATKGDPPKLQPRKEGHPPIDSAEKRSPFVHHCSKSRAKFPFRSDADYLRTHILAD